MQKDQQRIRQVARYTWSATEVKQVKEQLAEGQILPYVNWQSGRYYPMSPTPYCFSKPVVH